MLPAFALTYSRSFPYPIEWTQCLNERAEEASHFHLLLSLTAIVVEAVPKSFRSLGSVVVKEFFLE
jgi:hypothetical protein